MIQINNRYTGDVIYEHDGESLRDAVIAAIKNKINLRGADLREANLYGVSLYGADLRGANLYEANLYEANLYGVNLYGADLRGANLRRANLMGCAGNRKQIKSIFISEQYPITYTAEYLQIGCERHFIFEWAGFSDERIIEMDGKKALKFWRDWKETIFILIEKSPAVTTGKENKQ